MLLEIFKLKISYGIITFIVVCGIYVIICFIAMLFCFLRIIIEKIQNHFWK